MLANVTSPFLHVCNNQDCGNLFLNGVFGPYY